MAYVAGGMRRRDPDEQHRSSTPLELLFDLTFVVAVATVAAELAHDLVENHLGHGLVSYAMLFFAIWWAWMNFSWFASAYDCDDALYRVMTAVQMAGVLVLAAGVEPAFEEKDFETAVVGYVIMRIAMVGQWWRASSVTPRDVSRLVATPSGSWSCRCSGSYGCGCRPTWVSCRSSCWWQLSWRCRCGPSGRGGRPGTPSTSPSDTASSRSSCSGSRSSPRATPFPPTSPTVA